MSHGRTIFLGVCTHTDNQHSLSAQQAEWHTGSPCLMMLTSRTVNSIFKQHGHKNCLSDHNLRVPAGFPIDFAWEKLAGKVANCDQVNVRTLQQTLSTKFSPNHHPQMVVKPLAVKVLD